MCLLELVEKYTEKKCADKAGLQRLHLSKEELSPGPGFGDAFDLPEPSSRPYCWFSSLSKYCQINYQGRGQCSTESFLLYNYLEEKDFLNHPKSPESKHELLKNTQISGKYITFIVLKHWFYPLFLGMAHCVLWRCRHKPGATFNYDIITLQRHWQPWKN